MDDDEELRKHLLQCPVGTQNPALMTALSFLDDMQIKNQSHKAMPSSLSHKNGSFCESNDKSISSTTVGSESKYKSTPLRSHEAAQAISRCCLIDIPLILIFVIGICCVCLHTIHTEYLVPQIDLMRFTDEDREIASTYYERVCDPDDLSTDNTYDLLIGKNFSADDCEHHMMRHGMQMYEGILEKNTSESLRNFILKRNSELSDSESIFVLENQNRWSFGIGPNEHPIVSKALNEISTHSQFRPAIEKISGRNPAIIEFTAITSAYGAADQFWHADVIPGGSSVQYAQSFVPSYSLFIALQDISTTMGATDICPGTHMCSNEDGGKLCGEHGFRVTKDREWKAGNAILMNQQSFHRGPAHVDPNGPHRVLFIVTFAPRPIQKAETRQLGRGGSYSARWDIWGHNLYDLVDTQSSMSHPWAALRALGLYKQRGSDWGWTWIDQALMRIANDDNGYTQEDLELWVDDGGFGLPSIITLPMDDDHTWESYITGTISLWKDMSIRLNQVATSIFLLLSMMMCILRIMLMLYTQKKTSSQAFKYSLSKLFKAILRIAFYYGLLSSIAHLVMDHIANTNFAKDIKSQTLYRPPFDDIDEPSLLNHLTAAVSVNDILVGTRYNAEYLESNVHFLDYHPANQEFILRMKGIRSFFHNWDPFDKSRIAKKITDVFLADGYRFLIQDKNSDWKVMTSIESVEFVFKYLQQNYVLSKVEIVFGHLLRDEVKSKQITKLRSVYLESLREKMYSSNSLPSIVPSITMLTNRSISHIRKIRCFVKSHVSLTTTKKMYPTRERIIGASHDFEAINRGLQEEDIIEAQYQGEYNEWYKGQIVRVFSGSFIDVRYEDGQLDNYLPASSVVHFEPYQVDETIECRKFAEEEFMKATVLKVVSENDLMVKYKDGDVSVIPNRFVRRFRWIWRKWDPITHKSCSLDGKQWGKGSVLDVTNKRVKIECDDGSILDDIDVRFIRHWKWFPKSRGKHRF